MMVLGVEESGRSCISSYSSYPVRELVTTWCPPLQLFEARVYVRSSPSLIVDRTAFLSPNEIKSQHNTQCCIIHKTPTGDYVSFISIHVFSVLKLVTDECMMLINFCKSLIFLPTG